jgi:sigma-B regulation protein RsbU (phosphoserine phosphatase)
MLSLHVAPSDSDPFDRKVSGESLVIGRSSRTDLVISDRSLSREHARIFKAADGWFLEDLGSRNGTFINGERVRHIHAVSPGDVIALGGSTVRIKEVDGISDSDTYPSKSENALYKNAAAVLEDSRITQAEIDSRDGVSLKRYAEQLHMLNDVHQALCRSIDLGDLMELILDRVFDHLNPEQGAIFLRSPEGRYHRAASRSKAPGGEEFVYSESLLREVAEKGMAALVQDARSDDRFSQALSLLDAGIQSLVAAPLLDASGSLGMIVLTSNASLRQFTEDDMELLVSLASAAALRIRNMALAREAREKVLLEEELALARKIQVALLPVELPDLPGYEIDAHSRPSRRISGDYYEIVKRAEDSQCIFMITDVSGKGIGASLLAASLEALCAAPIEAGREPSQIFDRVSDLLYRRSQPEKYATSFLASLDPSTGIVTYANAGHLPGLVLKRSGEARWLAATGRPLGLLPESRFEQMTIALEPGDLLALYTDGITEALSPDSEEYGAERFLGIMLNHSAESLQDLSRRLDRDLESFANGTAFADDRTWVFLRRKDS